MCGVEAEWGSRMEAGGPGGRGGVVTGRTWTVILCDTGGVQGV